MDACLQITKTLIATRQRQRQTPWKGTEDVMERLDLWKPRATTQYVMPVSEAIPLGVHWHQRSWLCASTARGGKCRLCDLVPRRDVVYFAARCKTVLKSAGDPALVLIERSAAWHAEAERRSSLHWEEMLGRIVVCEEVAGRERQITETVHVGAPSAVRVDVEQLAFSIARLYRCPQFPCTATVEDAQDRLAAYSARQQMLLLHNAQEVL